MKKLSLILVILFIMAGCSQPAKEKKILAKINNYEITADEFEEEFKESPFARTDTPESRKEFLNFLINRKLILQEAQKQGLDKDKDFLKMIEKFWEQSLLKLTLDIKTKEIAATTVVDDRAVEAVYQKMTKDGKTDKPYEQMYKQIKWEIMQLKEVQRMNEWVDSLRAKANIKINDELLK